MNFLNNTSNKNCHKCITLSTIHRSKGLEWDIVYIINCNDEYIPGSGASEEDRRVFYVGATRAIHSLTISYLNTQHVNRLTRFVTELPEKLFVGDYHNNTNIKNINELEF